MKFNDISPGLQWYSVNGTSGLKEVTTFNLLMPAMLIESINK